MKTHNKETSQARRKDDLIQLFMEEHQLSLKPDVFKVVYEYFHNSVQSEKNGVTLKGDVEALLKDGRINDETLSALHDKHFNLAKGLIARLGLLIDTFRASLNSLSQEKEFEIQKMKQELDELKGSLDDAQKMYYQDAVTGIGNRARYEDIAKRMDEIIASNPVGYQQSLVVVDIDHFKKVNDTHGHAAGDDILQEVANRINNALRKGDEVVRYGGEEFVIFVKGDEFDAQKMAERVSKVVKHTPIAFYKESEPGFDATFDSLSVTVSMGACSINEMGSVSKAFSEADRCLYAAKNNGRDQVVSRSELNNYIQQGWMPEGEFDV